MKKGFITFALIAFICSLLCIIGCTAPDTTIQPTPDNKVTITYLIDGEIVFTQTAAKGDKYVNPTFTKDNYDFYGWYTTNKFETKLDFEIDTAETDLNVYGYWQPTNYTVTFVADGEEVAVKHYNVENKTVNAPPVPEKPHYTAQWEEFELTMDNIVVKAIYTPVEYTVNYIADEELVAQINYNVENTDITPPAVPTRLGYSGAWEQKQIIAGDVTINAVYTLNTYTAAFMIGERTISIQKFSVENMQIKEPVPTLPEKYGYEAQWERYQLSLENIIINAVYLPITYNADFYFDGEKVASVPFTVENESLQEPQLAEKTGYTANWESYEIKPENLKIDALFTPIIYYATFVCDGQVIEKIPFTIENMQIIEPAPVYKQGFTSKWEAYSLSCKDITIEAEYTEIIKDEFTYETLTDNTLTITGYTGSETSPVIPFEHGGVKITGIAEGAFAFSKIAELIIPDNITEIGELAFAHAEITKIKLSDNLTKISKNVFYHCEQLETVELGNHLKTICTNAFVNCPKLKSIVIPSSVTEIQPESFVDCASLNEIIFNTAENWGIYTENGTFIRELDADDLKNAATAADYIKRIFVSRYIKRQEINY